MSTIPTSPTSVPHILRAGDTWRWEVSLPDYPAPDWLLSYAFYSTAAVFHIPSTDNGNGKHLVHVAPTVTAARLAGRYDWAATVICTASGDRWQITTGVITIEPDLSLLTAFDGRSPARRVLDALEAVIENRAVNGDLDVIGNAFNGLNITRNPELLLKTRAQYAAIVHRELNPATSIRMHFL